MKEIEIYSKFRFCLENLKMEKLTGKNPEQFLRSLDGFDGIIVN